MILPAAREPFRLADFPRVARGEISPTSAAGPQAPYNFCMKSVGHRRLRQISAQPSGKLLAEGARANADLLSFPGVESGFIPKGVYLHRTLAMANRQWDECLAKAMARRRQQAR